MLLAALVLLALLLVIIVRVLVCNAHLVLILNIIWEITHVYPLVLLDSSRTSLLPVVNTAIHLVPPVPDP